MPECDDVMNETAKKSIGRTLGPINQVSQTSVKFIHQKNASFRAFPADGVWGVLTPSGGLQVEVYTEHQPVPDAVIHSFNPDGTISEGFRAEGALTTSEQAIMIRDFHTAIIVSSLQCAIQLHDLLSRYIEMQKAMVRQNNPPTSQEGVK